MNAPRGGLSIAVRIRMLYERPACAVLLCVAMTGCASVPSVPRDALQASPEMEERRALQTRVFDTGDEDTMLLACAAILQDTGFILGETDTGAGLIIASKRRVLALDAKRAAKAVVWVYGGWMIPRIHADVMGHGQVFKACVVTRPISDNRIVVRVAFQRQVLDDQDKAMRIEMMNVPEVYQEFFSRLSKAVFLKEQRI